jgi:hypothetical protein
VKYNQKKWKKVTMKPKKRRDTKKESRPKAWGSRKKEAGRSKVKRKLKQGKVETSDDIEWMEYDD